MRDAAAGLEVLLLQRNDRAGFVPGAYVFPGGRVDPGDSAPEALAYIDGVSPERAAQRLALPDGEPPAIAYYVAALREAFEETGILVGERGESGLVTARAKAREDLLCDRIGFGEALARLERRVAADALEYLAHWITPERQPRRYDTRFFAARVGPDAEAVIDPREMIGSLWVTPAEALHAGEGGQLPMILPTVRTLEQLAAFPDTAAVLQALPGMEVPTILPGGRSVGP